MPEYLGHYALEDESGLWVVTIRDGNGRRIGVTQARHLGEVDEKAQDLIATITDQDGPFDITFT